MINGVTINSVKVLYQSFDRMDRPAFYEKGDRNPFEGLCMTIPHTASFYALVPERDDLRVEVARKLLHGLDRRRKVKEIVKEKYEINYNQFESASRIVVIYV